METNADPQVHRFLPEPAPTPIYPRKYVVVLNGWPGVGKRAIAASICEKAGPPDWVTLFDHCGISRTAPAIMDRASVALRQIHLLEHTRRTWRDENLAPKLGRAGAV